MNIISKELIPDKEWILKDGDNKIGSVLKNKKGFILARNGSRFNFKDISDLGIELPKNNVNSSIEIVNSYSIYDYPCSTKPFSPVYNLKKKLPIFTKSTKSKSQFCAGYYIIKFRKGWVKSFCPKLITLERYPYQGPYKTENEMKQELNKLK